MTKQEWLRLRPYARIKSNPRGGWSNFVGKRSARNKAKHVGTPLVGSTLRDMKGHIVVRNATYIS